MRPCGNAQHGKIASAIGDRQIDARQLRMNWFAVSGDLQFIRPGLRLFAGLRFQRTARAVALQLPGPEQIEGGKFGEIERVLQVDAVPRHLEPGVMIDAEVPHGMAEGDDRHQWKEQSKQKFPSKRWHRLWPVRFGTGPVHLPSGPIASRVLRAMAAWRKSNPALSCKAFCSCFLASARSPSAFAIIPA